MKHFLVRMGLGPKPSPMLPNVTIQQYEAERPGVFVVYNSMPRVCQIGPFKFRVTATDWSSIKEAETAASKLAVMLNEPGEVSYGKMNVTEIIDHMAEAIRRDLGVDDTRPLGFCFVAEPI